MSRVEYGVPCSINGSKDEKRLAEVQCSDMVSKYANKANPDDSTPDSPMGDARNPGHEHYKSRNRAAE